MRTIDSNSFLKNGQHFQEDRRESGEQNGRDPLHNLTECPKIYRKSGLHLLTYIFMVSREGLRIINVRLLWSLIALSISSRQLIIAE